MKLNICFVNWAARLEFSSSFWLTMPHGAERDNYVLCLALRYLSGFSLSKWVREMNWESKDCINLIRVEITILKRQAWSVVAGTTSSDPDHLLLLPVCLTYRLPQSQGRWDEMGNNGEPVDVQEESVLKTLRCTGGHDNSILTLL